MDKKEQKYLMDQLAKETFKKDVDEFSYKRVEALVQLMEVNEPTDSKGAEEAQKKFEKKFQQMTAKKCRINVQKFARIAAVICILVLGANLTTEALMDDNVFHMIQRWGNRYEIIPSDNQVEYQESDTKVFTDIEEFESYFGDDFLVCSWLPDGYELDEITYVDSGDLHNYIWNYSDKINNIVIQMFSKTDNSVVSLIKSDFINEEKVDLTNEITGIICETSDEYLVCFEYNDWWYLIYSTNKETSIKIAEGMLQHEKN